MGTTLQVLAGLFGVDSSLDIRDLFYDLTNFETSKQHILQTILDAVALVPVVGSIKYADEVGDTIKAGAKYGDEATQTIKSLNKADTIENFSSVILNNKGIKEVISNLDFKIDITPSIDHKFVLNNPGYMGIPNSSIDIIDKKGVLKTRRWYDQNGNPIKR